MFRVSAALVVLVACHKGADTADTPTPTTPTDTAPVETGDSAAPAALVVQHGVIACADPAARLGEGEFVALDVSAVPGTVDVVPRFPIDDTDPEGQPTAGYGLAVADVTGDGVLDLVLPRNGQTRLWVGQGDGTAWVDETDLRMPEITASSEAVIPGDVDGDGDLDLALLVRGAPNLLLVNDGGVFTLAEGAFPAQDRATVGGAFADLDMDGDLDLVLANHDPTEEPPQPLDGGDDNELYLNQGDGTFISAEELFPPTTLGAYTFIALVADLNGDLAPDIYLGNDRGESQVGNKLLRNDGAGHFRDVSNETYANLRMGAMGFGVGDLNGDQLPDIAITDWGPIRLLETWEDGTYVSTEAARALGGLEAYESHALWGIALEDLDNDGDLDMPVAAGQLMRSRPDQDNPLEQPDAMLYQQADGTFANRAAELGLDDPANHRGLLTVDLNRDGWVDLALRDLNARPALWAARCGDEAWLEVDVSQDGMNRFGVGAEVRVTVGDVTHVRWILAGGISLSTAGPPEVHFGLGDADVADELVVRWPDGAVTVATDVPLRQRVTALYPSPSNR